MGTRLICAALIAASWAMTGCESEDPEERRGTAGAAGTAGQDGAPPATCDVDQGMTVTDNASCQPLATDYRPRDNGSQDDSWPACISDDNAYHPFNASVGSNARIAAFEVIREKLGFGGLKEPGQQDFLDAKVAYSESEGLQSRISRREDNHFPPATKNGETVQCRDLSADEQKAFPDRCVGSVRIQPLAEDALNNGTLGKEPALNAARVEAALLWFSLISVYKETDTCFSSATVDCDSATAYYAGKQVREDPIGLGKYVISRSPQAHDRVWDALMAARCARDLDQATPATTPLWQQSLAQLDRALLRGYALIVRDRLQNVATCPVAWESVRILGPVLDRAAKERDSAAAAALLSEFSKTDAAQVDIQLATNKLDQLFDCP